MEGRQTEYKVDGLLLWLTLWFLLKKLNKFHLIGFDFDRSTSSGTFTDLSGLQVHVQVAEPRISYCSPALWNKPPADPRSVLITVLTTFSRTACCTCFGLTSACNNDVYITIKLGQHHMTQVSPPFPFSFSSVKTFCMDFSYLLNLNVYYSHIWLKS